MDSKNEQTIIIKDYDESLSKENSFKWSTYFHFTNVYKYWILGISLVSMIGGYLAVSLGVNPNLEHFSTSFKLTLPLNKTSVTQKATDGTVKQTDQITYLDGSAFSPLDIISSGLIKTTLKSNDTLLKVSYEKLVKDNSLSISYKEGTNPEDLYFTLKCNLKPFNNEETAKVFVDTLIKNFTNLANAKAKNYKISNLVPSKEKLINYNYDKILNFMSAQYDNIITNYDKLAEEYNSNTVINEDGNTIAEKTYELSQTTKKDLSNLKLSFDKFNFIRYSENAEENTKTIDNLKDEAESLKEALEQYVDLINFYTNIINSSNSQTTDTTKLLDALLEAKSNYNKTKKELEAIGYKVNETTDTNKNISFIVLDPEDSNNDLTGMIQNLENPTEEWLTKLKEFDTKIDAMADTFIQDTEYLNQSMYYCFEEYATTIKYDSIALINIEGDISPMLGAIGFLFLAFVISSLSFACYGYNKNKQDIEKNNEEKPVENKNK